jgi:hypothetical protein
LGRFQKVRIAEIARLASTASKGPVATGATTLASECRGVR